MDLFSGFSPLRLMNGTDRCSGRVEILHDGQWGTVCDDEWDIRDAQVVCRAMDCGTAQTVKSGAFFGQGQGDIWLDDVNCLGNETSLVHCQRPSFGENNCGHGEDAGVVCAGIISIISLLASSLLFFSTQFTQCHTVDLCMYLSVASWILLIIVKN